MNQVKELTNKELQNVDGGICIPCIALGVAAYDFLSGVRDGFNG